MFLFSYVTLLYEFHLAFSISNLILCTHQGPSAQSVAYILHDGPPDMPIWASWLHSLINFGPNLEEYLQILSLVNSKQYGFVTASWTLHMLVFPCMLILRPSCFNLSCVLFLFLSHTHSNTHMHCGLSTVCHTTLLCMHCGLSMMCNIWCYFVFLCHTALI